MSPQRILWLIVAILGLFSFASSDLKAQSPSGIVMVEIQCKPGTADLWRDAFMKDTLPAIQEAINKHDVFTNFSLLEAPLPGQNIDFVLIFEMKSFAALDVRRIPPHYQVLLQRLGPEGFANLEKQMGGWEQRVTVNIFRSYKVQQ